MEIVDKYLIARWCYLLGRDYISDAEYDRLHEYIICNKLLPDEVTGRGWSEDPCPVEVLKRYGMEDLIVPVIYQFKTESIQSINDESVMYNELSNFNESARISMKIDGFSIRLNYFNGSLINVMTRTRADGVSLDLSKIEDLFKKNIAMKGQVLIVGELYLKTSTLEEYKRLRGIVSQRNGVSTAIANGDWKYLGYKCFHIYTTDYQIEDKFKVLESLELPVPKYHTINNYSNLLTAIRMLGRYKEIYDAPVDGMVFESSKHKYALRVGEFAEQKKSSVVKGYIFNRGMYSNSISVEIEPLVMNDKTVTRVSVTNPQMVIDYNLKIGAPIAVVERSGVNFVLDCEETVRLHQEAQYK